METLDRVKERFAGILTERDAGEARLEELDGLIAVGIASGDDVTKLQAERRQLVDDLDDKGAALRLLDDRRETIEAEQRERHRAGLLGTARRDRDAMLAACETFDVKLAELEDAFGAVTKAELRLATSARLAGHGDGGRIARNMKRAVQWAMCQSAPATAEAAGVPRSNSNRKSLRVSVANSAPNLEE